MKIDEQFDINADPDNVWAVLRDPAAVALCFPGAELTDATDDGAFVGRIRVRFGPTVASFAGQAKIAIDDTTHSAVIEAQGKDGRGSSRAKANAVVQLTDADGRSTVTLIGSIDVTGPLGSFTETGGVYVARELMRDFALNVAARVAAAGADDCQQADEVAVSSAPAPISAGRVMWQVVKAALAKAVRRLRRRGEQA